MKKILFLCLFFGFFHAHAQEVSFPLNITPRQIVAKLFDAKWNDKNECVWKPNFAEKATFGTSDDGFLYTKMDTVLSYKNFVYITVYTFKKSGGTYDNCHVCAPNLGIIVIEKNANEQIVRSVEKLAGVNGSWGEGDPVELLPISEEEAFLVVNGGYSGQGMTTEYKSFYYYTNQILFLTISDSNGGAAMEDSEMYAFDTDIKVDKNNKILTFHKKGTEMNNGKIVKLDQTSTYEFRDGQLQKVCK